jgi:hypothetical protein
MEKKRVWPGQAGMDCIVGTGCCGVRAEQMVIEPANYFLWYYTLMNYW